MTLARWNELTAAEKSALESSFTGPITEQAVADVIRMRPARTPEWLRKTIDQLLIDVQWHNAEAKKYAAANDTWMANHHNRNAREKLEQVDALDVERAEKLAALAEPLSIAAE